MKKISRIILLLIIVFLVVAQLIPLNNPEVKEADKNDIFQQVSAEKDLELLVKAACYDCHSYQTSFPWYNSVAPVSWWLKDHIEDGRKHLNFSNWSAYSTEKKEHKLEECVEMLEEGEMPLWSYQITHAEARLSEGQKKLLIDWFKALSKEYH